jgi:hypothetical protein
MIRGSAITVQSGDALPSPLTLGIIPADRTIERVYLDSKALHIYGIAPEHDCGVAPGTQLRDVEIPYLSSEERSLTRPRERRDFAAHKEISCALAASCNEHSAP